MIRWVLMSVWIVMVMGCDTVDTPLDRVPDGDPVIGRDTLDTLVDRVPDGDPMDTDSVEVRGVYFPASLGKTWQYVYRHVIGDPFSGVFQVTEGNLTWTIIDSLAVAYSTQWRIQERFEGLKTETRSDGQHTEYPVIWERTLTALLGEERLELGMYTDRLPTVQWAYPEATADTVRVDILLAVGFGRATSKHITLVRDVGVVAWWGGTSGRVANYEKFYLDEDASGAETEVIPKL